MFRAQLRRLRLDLRRGRRALTASAADRPGGLSAAELELVIGEIRGALRDATVVDVARVTDRDDLLVFVETADGKRALHVAPGGRRARVCMTRRRFPKHRFARTPQVVRLSDRLRGARLRNATQRAGDRACSFEFECDERQRAALVVELFGPRGLWCLLDGDSTVVEMSRAVTTKDRELRVGRDYLPPAPPQGSAPSETRFEAPVCEQVDEYFTAIDLREEQDRDRLELDRALRKAQQKLRARVDGLRRQQEQISDAASIRQMADMLLAYAFQVQRGDTELVVPHPEDAERELHIPLDPARPAHAQAEALYKRARKLEDSADVSARRLADATSELERVDALASRLAAATDVELPELRDELQERGLLSPAPASSAPQPPPLRKITGGENFRRFTSNEGYLIMVGRTNAQNDKLSIRTARGNDLWFHVGQGYAGSHVVVRLPRGKTASLETMLDAGTLAIHFSKARGNPLCEVIYTQAKHVRKPRGLPAGRVVPSHTKTLRVRHEADRLARLLGE